MKFSEVYNAKLILDTMDNKKVRDWAIKLWDKDDPFYIDYLHDKIISGDMTEEQMLRYYFVYHTRKRR